MTKKNMIVFIIFLLVFMQVCYPYALTIDEVFKMEMQTSDFNALEAQSRYFLVGGSFHLKSPAPATVNPVKIVPPVIQAGCGGISIMSGALSFMNFDQLVSLLQGVVAAAPGVAVRLILSTVCPQCDTIMASVMHLVNQINSMNFNSCQIAQNLMGQVGSLVGLKTGSEVSEGQNDWQQKIIDNLNNASSAISSFINSLTQECGTDATCKSATEGKFIIKPSLLEIVRKTEPNVFDANLIDLLRAFYGDIYEEMVNNNMTVKALDPLGDYSNSSIVKIIALGNGVVDSNGNITLKTRKINTTNDGYFSDVTDWTITFQPYKFKIEKLLSDIVDKVFFGEGNFSPSSLTTEEKQLINSLPVPILAFIMQASLAQKATGAPYFIYAQQYIKDISESMAVIIAYNKILELNRLVRTGIAKYKASLQRKDNQTVFTVIDDYVRKLEFDLMYENATLYAEASKKLSEINVQMANKYKEVQVAVTTALFNTGLLDKYRWR